MKDRPLIGAVGEQFPEKGKQTEQGRQQRETAVAILNVGGGDDAVQQQALPTDMLPMANQVSIAIFFSVGTIAQLADIEAPDTGTDNASFAGLKGRIAKAVEFIKGVTPEQLEGSEDRGIELTQAGATRNFTGLVFLLNHAMPQFHFHATTAYDLLRQAGVEIGKRDFMGEYPS